MARCLIIGCGCRGRLLAGELKARGHAVRGTTRHRTRLAELEAGGVEAVLADPDRLATLAGAFDHVSVVCVLLGSAVGDRDALRALHGPRLQMLLSRALDTTVRGLLYEAAGSVEADVLGAGAALVSEVCSRSRIPYALLYADPTEHGNWTASALTRIDRLLNT